MSNLKTNLEAILQEKQDKIIPENIKKDISIFDIIGTYTGIGEVKLFETEEEMQADENAQEGDLAVVYREELQNMTAETQTQYVTFPETVTLTEAVTSSYYCMLRAVDTSVMFDSQVQLNASSFRFNGYSETGMIMVQYTSTDGLTYTRTMFQGDSGSLTNPVDLGTIIEVYNSDEWNDSIGYFMQASGNVFGGLYEYSSYTDLDLYLPDYSTLSYTSGISIEISENVISLDKIKSVVNALDKKDYVDYDIAYDGTYYYVIPYTQSASLSQGYYDTVNDKLYFTIDANAQDSTSALESPPLVYVVNNDLEVSSTINISTLSEVIFVFGSASTNYCKITELALSNKTMLLHYGNTFGETQFYNDGFRYGSGIGSSVTSSNYYSITNTHPLKYMYMTAPNQLTATKDLVYNSIYSGKDGVNEGTLTQDVSNSFADINAEVYYKIRQAYDTMEPRVLTNSDKLIDKNIYGIPINEDDEPLLDTSQLTIASNLFSGCVNLTTIPLLNTSNVTDMLRMFQNCTNLTTIPLLDTSSATTLYGMFDGCINLISVPEFNTSNVENVNSMFYNCSSLTSVPLFNMSKVTQASSMFEGCTNLISVPQFNTTSNNHFSSMFRSCTNLIVAPTLDTTSAINVNYMFSGCTNLQTVPVYNISGIGDYMQFTSMFENCPNLSNDSLNNILQMCATHTSTASRKTLKMLGLSEEQATTCKTLSNYQAFLDAGWTTGY